jgi:hypothetical protein
MWALLSPGLGAPILVVRNDVTFLGRSLRLSAALLPSILLFVVVKDHLDGVRQIRLLYLMCSTISSDTSVEIPTEARKATTAVVRGDQESVRRGDPKRTASALIIARPISEKYDGSGRTSPAR